MPLDQSREAARDGVEGRVQQCSGEGDWLWGKEEGEVTRTYTEKLVNGTLSLSAPLLQ
jgi:hypothetical protein